MIPWLDAGSPFPSVESALTEPNGLLAAGGDLSLDRLLDAYAQGIFPWYQNGEPILWWSPDPRMVLLPHELKLSRSLVKTLKQKRFEVKIDTAFRDVIDACAGARAAPGRKRSRATWITPQMRSAYVNLHRAGFAHSVESYCEGKLAGGLYGVALGRVFFGESMFYRVSDGSKIALAHLVRQLARWKFAMIDCQMETPHLASFGARSIARREFTGALQELVHYPAPAAWVFDHDLFE
jgi:leucyl/phenylalanyl-tRNA---protein transferase